MKAAADRVIGAFRENIRSVDELVNFDRSLLEFVLIGLRTLADDLRAKENLNTASKRVDNRVMAFENVRKNDSLRPKYETMFNQCVVLLVSYFSSAVHDLFRAAASYAFSAGASVPVVSEEVKLSWHDFFSTGAAPSEVFADVLVAQRDISFQDMQSIARAFSTHFELNIERSVVVNDIVIGQAARHVIVHAGATVDSKMVRQLSGAHPRTLKLHIAAGETITFIPEEIAVLAARMDEYLVDLAAKLVGRLEGNNLEQI